MFVISSCRDCIGRLETADIFLEITSPVVADIGSCVGLLIISFKRSFCNASNVFMWSIYWHHSLPFSRRSGHPSPSLLTGSIWTDVMPFQSTLRLRSFVPIVAILFFFVSICLYWFCVYLLLTAHYCVPSSALYWLHRYGLNCVFFGFANIIIILFYYYYYCIICYHVMVK